MKEREFKKGKDKKIYGNIEIADNTIFFPNPQGTHKRKTGSVKKGKCFIIPPIPKSKKQYSNLSFLNKKIAQIIKAAGRISN